MDYIELRRRLVPGFTPGLAEPPAASSPASTLSADTAALIARLEQIRRRGRVAPRQAVPAIAERLGGEEVAPGLVEVVRRYPLALRHGRRPLREVAALCRDEGGALRWGQPLVPERLLFLDTETTGLAGGAGTLAFLAGVARLSGACLEVRQWLLTAFAGEGALFEQLAGILGPEDVLVSFNGKSFDVPLLDSRARLQGREASLRGRPHIDLLHALRRAHGKHLPDCRLQTAEAHLLGLTRHDDLPGDQAPQAWRDWLRHGQAGRLNDVLAHNRNDLLSTAMLLAVLAGVGGPCSGDLVARAAYCPIE